MKNRILIVDAHQDIAWNILTFGRDYTRTLEETRAIEVGSVAPTVNGDTLLGWDVYQRGNLALVFATLFAAPIRSKDGDWETLCYTDNEEAYRLYRQQADTYHCLVDKYPDKFTLIQTKDELRSLIVGWQNSTHVNPTPVGLVVLMEGADCIHSPDDLVEWWSLGVRIIGLAWMKTRYSGGTGEPGPLTKEGYRLLDGMAEFGISLDISHMDEEAVLQALDHFPGRIIASHANPQKLLDSQHNRFLSDRVLQGLIEREGIVGIVPYNRFLKQDWAKGDPREGVSLEDVVAHIDYVCQIAGNTRHVGIGSDADGGFGLQSVPKEMDSLADLQKLVPFLEKKGYSHEDIQAILGGNWIEFLLDTLPEEK
ncbi:MAG: membrane dipeptidase [Anaerolineales bacterium]|jgi:membrane dipeptidase